MIRSIIAAIAVSLLFWGCSAPKAYLNPEWKSQPQSVKVVYTEPIIDSQKDLEDDLPEFADNFSQWFQVIASERIDQLNRYQVSFSFEKRSNKEMKLKTVKLGKKDLQIPYFKNMEGADVYLVLKDLWFGRETETQYTNNVGPNGMMVAGVSQHFYFRAKCVYAFYDVNTGELLGYGDQIGTSSYNFVVDAGDWERATRDLISNILKKTPVIR